MKTKSQETKDSILQATLELIAEQGFHGTSISQIAERANVNVGSMYYHFTNKDEILKALYIDCKIRVTRYAFHNCSDALPADECLKLVMGNIVRYCTENGKEFSFLEQFENSPYFTNAAFIEKYTEIMKPYGDIYEQLKGQGLIKDLPMEVSQSLLLGAVSSLTKHYLHSEDKIDETVLVAAINAIWDMVKK